MRTMFKLVTACLVTTAILGGTTAAASAKSETMKDKRADVVHVDVAPDGVETSSILDAAASYATGVDATSTTVKHGKNTIRVTIRFAYLSSRNVRATTLIRTSGKDRPLFSAHGGGSNKYVYVYDKVDDARLCTRPQTYKQGLRGYLTFTIRRSCIGNPKSIKVSSTIERTLWVSGVDRSSEYLTEVIAPAAFRTPAWTRWLKSS